MHRKRFLLPVVATLVIAFAVAWQLGSDRIACLTLDRLLKVEINGVRVQGEILSNGTNAIVTRRDAGKSHSYQLFFEGDIDSNGDTGTVVDCHEWVAPHFPLLLGTRTYPPCKHLLEDGPGRWPLVVRSKSMQFVLKDNSTVSVVPPD
jgi:hypothetical protein